MVDFAKEVRVFMAEHDLSAGEMGELFSVCHSSISRWARGGTVSKKFRRKMRLGMADYAGPGDVKAAPEPAPEPEKVRTTGPIYPSDFEYLRYGEFIEGMVVMSDNGGRIEILRQDEKGQRFIELKMDIQGGKASIKSIVRALMAGLGGKL